MCHCLLQAAPYQKKRPRIWCFAQSSDARACRGQLELEARKGALSLSVSHIASPLCSALLHLIIHHQHTLLLHGECAACAFLPVCLAAANRTHPPSHRSTTQPSPSTILQPHPRLQLQKGHITHMMDRHTSMKTRSCTITAARPLPSTP